MREKKQVKEERVWSNDTTTTNNNYNTHINHATQLSKIPVLVIKTQRKTCTYFIRSWWADMGCIWLYYNVYILKSGGESPCWRALFIYRRSPAYKVEELTGVYLPGILTPLKI